jgi:hypothetical protein
MAATTRKKKKAAPRRKKKAGRFRFQLSIAEVAGIGVVVFCLFLWMFLLGIWAGQTILLPKDGSIANRRHTVRKQQATQAGRHLIRPRAVKRTVHP